MIYIALGEKFMNEGIKRDEPKKMIASYGELIDVLTWEILLLTVCRFEVRTNRSYENIKGISKH